MQYWIHYEEIDIFNRREESWYKFCERNCPNVAQTLILFMFFNFISNDQHKGINEQ